MPGQALGLKTLVSNWMCS